ncbi:thiamine-binding protein [Chryseolinea lacunae]|uniref:Thiamine-binding protein n=1 Tax=Chryseolinea lacunae TaxID=2801331 RepID=A0ABS1KZN6_9BACT|nr:thiamine-binding protein [Chryseolinea lacunae]MBL0744933.1 thiamine-binding protein [Chryseolinea lacunae]
MNHQVHVAIQIVPISKEHPYPIIDKAIEAIDEAGVVYRVGAMETVMQGDYDALMTVVKKAQEACFAAGADELVVTLKVHARKNGDVTWEEKLHKYETE